MKIYFSYYDKNSNRQTREGRIRFKSSMNSATGIDFFVPTDLIATSIRLVPAGPISYMWSNKKTQEAHILVKCYKKDKL